MKIWTIPIMEGSYHVLLSNRNFSLSAKVNGHKKDTGKPMKNASFILDQAPLELNESPTHTP